MVEMVAFSCDYLRSLRDSVINKKAISGDTAFLLIQIFPGYFLDFTYTYIVEFVGSLGARNESLSS